MVKNRVLFITIDYHKSDEIKESFSIASIISYCQNKGIDWKVSKISIDTLTDISAALDDIRHMFAVNDYIMFGLYSWSEKYVQKIIAFKLPHNVICIGGYNVCATNIDGLRSQYKLVNHFIIGYAEESIYQLVTGLNNREILSERVDERYLSGIYSNKILDINKSIRTIRFFTKLGCIYKCEYCAHRDVNNNRVINVPLSTAKKDLDAILVLDIDKVNFIDPTFNIPSDYLDIMRYLIEINFPFQVSFQVSFSLISDEFLDLCRKLNCILEFGIQDIDSKITQIVNRRQDIKTINEIVSKLNSNHIKHELSFIIGLPYQTVDSVKNDIQWIKENVDERNCIVYFNRLMLLPGTALYNRKNEYLYVEKEINGIQYIKQTKWITETEMDQLIVNLKELNFLT